jgi:uncharacterized protein (TIGR03905 family)
VYSLKHEYNPRGVCAKKIEFDINDGVISDLKIIGGCPGYSSGMAKLVVGMKADDVIDRLENIRCGTKPSSCPAQLALALKAIK